MGGSTTLTIRLDRETKEQIERLSAVLGVNLSDLIRQYVIPLAKVAVTLEATKMVENLERAVLKAIIASNEFQELLKKLKKLLKEEEFCGGYNCEYKYSYRVLPSGTGISFLTITEVDKILWPARIERYVENWHDYWEIEEIKTLRELVEWLRDLEETLAYNLREKIQEIKEAVRFFLS